MNTFKTAVPFYIYMIAICLKRDMDILFLYLIASQYSMIYDHILMEGKYRI